MDIEQEIEDTIRRIDISLSNINQQIARKTMNSDHTYRFVSRAEDVDYLRIIRETPKHTPFVLVEERSRQDKQTKGWTLFIHRKILNNPILQGKHIFEPLSPDWGISSFPDVREYPYRYISHSGKFPGIMRHKIDKLKSFLNGKDTLTEVKYL